MVGAASKTERRSARSARAAVPRLYAVVQNEHSCPARAPKVNIWAETRRRGSFFAPEARCRSAPPWSRSSAVLGLSMTSSRPACKTMASPPAPRMPASAARVASDSHTRPDLAERPRNADRSACRDPLVGRRRYVMPMIRWPAATRRATGSADRDSTRRQKTRARPAHSIAAPCCSRSRPFSAGHAITVCLFSEI